MLFSYFDIIISHSFAPHTRNKNKLELSILSQHTNTKGRDICIRNSNVTGRIFVSIPHVLRMSMKSAICYIHPSE